MTKDTSKTLTLNPSTKTLEKLQELKNFFDQGGKEPKKNSTDQKINTSTASHKKSSSSSSFINKKKTSENDNKKIEEDTKKIQLEAKLKRFKQMQLALNWLMETYSLCFNKETPKPLKRHIEKDIFPTLPNDLPFSRLSLREALAYYTRSPKYRQAIIGTSHRYNLQGEAVEEILPEHHQRAKEQLESYKQKREQQLLKKKESFKMMNSKSKDISLL